MQMIGFSMIPKNIRFCSMKMKEIREKLNGIADTVGKNKSGNFVARKEYFFHHGATSDGFVEKVKRTLPEARIINSWDRWASFKGGSSVASNSHFGVEFTI